MKSLRQAKLQQLIDEGTIKPEEAVIGYVGAYSFAEVNLNEDEKSMIDRVSSVYHQAGKPVVVVINSGSVMETASWRDAVDAILVAWQPGEEGGNSVADVLTGKVNPSGHLTMTWPISAYDVPSTNNFPQTPDYYNFTDKFAAVT